MTLNSQYKFIPLPSDKNVLENNYEKYFKIAENHKRKEDFKKNAKDNKNLLDSVFGNSPYLSKIIVKQPDYFLSLNDDGFEKSFNKIISKIKNLKTKEEKLLSKELRVLKQQAGLCIAMAEISGHWEGDTAMEKLSEFADCCIQKACEFLLKSYDKKELIDLKDSDDVINGTGLIVIAVGKLGSNELNYSSDIDLIIFFEDNKILYRGRKTTQIFFVEFAQKLIDILSRKTQDGYVFRVDMRLRPDPASNPLAVSLEKAETYYFTVGQNWERAAMIKSRIIYGDNESTKIFRQFMDRNVWRKALDYETIEDIHSIKRQIDTREGLPDENLYDYNLKIGKGGIREIEFFCQTQQLIWGGRKNNLRARKTTEALDILFEEGEIQQEEAMEMKNAYNFYRFVEHRLQMINDEQTHNLPKNDEKMRELAIFCNYANEKEFISKLKEKIATVRKNYSRLFESSPTLASLVPEARGSLIFTGSENHPETLSTLNKMGFKNSERVSEIIRGWHYGRYKCTEKKRSRAVLTKLMPMLLSSFSKSPDPDEAFIRLDDFLSRVPEGSQIFSMLFVNPSIMDLLAEVLGGYKLLSSSLIKNPILLDYVLAPEFYNTLPNREYLRENLEKVLEEANGNLDDEFEIVKDWASDRKFRIGIQLVRNEIDNFEVQYGLSNIAEIVISTLIDRIRKDFESNIGKFSEGEFAVLALGKLGSKELTFNSDLDLVFVYDYPESTIPVGDNKMSPASYYVRVASKLVYALSSITSTGKLYEVDLRLRPLGEAGPIASSFKSIDQYYNPDRKEGSAWIWEYMALTRSRVISNDISLKNKLQGMIKNKIFHKWDESTLNEGVEFIYKKFRQKTPDGKNFYDVKNCVGGLFDLEFMIRYLQLKNLHIYPELKNQSTPEVINLLSMKKIIESKEEEELVNSFSFFTKLQNILRITSEVKITKHIENKICYNLDIKNTSEMKKNLEFHKSKVKFLFNKYMQIK